MSARRLRMLLLLVALGCGLGFGAGVRAQDLDDEDEKDSSAESDRGGDAKRESDTENEGGARRGGAADDTQSEPESEPAGDAPNPGDDASEGPRFTFSPFAGLGLGTRSFERPTPLGGQRLGTVSFPAADVGLALTAWPKASFSLGVLLRYQTSIGMRIEERPPFALPNDISARSERAELSAAPTLRLGAQPLAPAIAFPIGMAIRTLWPSVHNGLTPGYTLLGPLVRVEFLVPFSDTLRLRVGPEAHWIIAIDRSLRRDGVDSQAFSIGGEAALTLGLSSSFALDVSYREAHASASSVNGGALFKDVERFVTARLLGVL